MQPDRGRYRYVVDSGVVFKPRTLAFEQMTLKQAFAIGRASAVLPYPGVSRHVDHHGGMLTGLDCSTATGFSFFLSIPTLGAASIYSLKDRRCRRARHREHQYRFAFFIHRQLAFYRLATTLYQ